MLRVFLRTMTSLARPSDVAGPQQKKHRAHKTRKSTIEPYSHDDVLWHDVRALLGDDAVHHAEEQDTDWDSPFHFRQEIEVVVDRLSSHGNVLALNPAGARSPWVIVAPFALPGESIRVRAYRSARLHSFADLLTPNSSRGTTTECSASILKNVLAASIKYITLPSIGYALILPQML